MQILRIFAVASFALGLLGSPTPASAFSTGAMIQIESAPPDFLDEVVTVGAGIESLGFGALVAIDLFDGGVQLDFIGPFTLAPSPNGVLFSDFGNTLDPIIGVSINPATTVAEFLFGFTEDTVEVAQSLPVTLIQHEQNTGYGGNQKTCYDEALRREEFLKAEDAAGEILDLMKEAGSVAVK